MPLLFRKCRELLDDCNVATHCGKSFSKNCHARLFPTATITSPLPTDSSISRESAQSRSLFSYKRKLADISQTRATRTTEGISRKLEGNSVASLRGKQKRSQPQNVSRSVKDSNCGGVMSSPQNQLSTGENRTRVTLSTCESATSRESRTAVPDIPRRKCSCLPLAVASRNPCVPSRRRVSFSDAVVDHDRRTIMQNDLTCSRHDNSCRADNGERETFYDIWQADDSVAGRSDDGYESTPRIDNYSENRVSGYTFNKGRDSSENVDENVVRDGRMRDTQDGDGESDVRSADRVAEDMEEKIEYEDGTMSNEDVSNSFSYKDVDSIGRDECRMRGGCGGCCGAPRENIRRSSQNHGCCCCYCGGGLVAEPNESCAPEPTRCDSGVKAAARTAITAACTVVPAPRCCCRCAQGCRRAVCKKAATSSRCRSILGSGCCANDRTKCGADGACCRQKLPVSCECFGGGLDCRRCGRKVYQAEMQIASGAPYHNICFSCFCCRKPLESLTYQENCGEIYCKQCYVRNFGPQGYGYGAGAGVLQTPL
ncbi:uncharacterized protein LOC116849501 [Odontomachus brunneus]|uniref:uncharacterized protein LOC116849501 n=1 Tax=Odontomachus brunneus TaxID=486640 RepID=UPI0013F1E223|nr:uncharacterized protein LOC116849501 [Odontomachus brunneus]